MQMTARGWGRNMGWKTLGSFLLQTLKASTRVRCGEAVVYHDGFGVTIRWHQKLHMNGDYLCDLHLNSQDLSVLIRRYLQKASAREASFLFEKGFGQLDDKARAALFLKRFGAMKVRHLVETLAVTSPDENFITATGRNDAAAPLEPARALDAAQPLQSLVTPAQ